MSLKSIASSWTSAARRIVNLIDDEDPVEIKYDIGLINAQSDTPSTMTKLQAVECLNAWHQKFAHRVRNECSTAVTVSSHFELQTKTYTTQIIIYTPSKDLEIGYVKVDGDGVEANFYRHDTPIAFHKGPYKDVKGIISKFESDFFGHVSSIGLMNINSNLPQAAL